MCRIPLSDRYIDSSRDNEYGQDYQDYVSGFLHVLSHCPQLLLGQRHLHNLDSEAKIRKILTFPTSIRRKGILFARELK